MQKQNLIIITIFLLVHWQNIQGKGLLESWNIGNFEEDAYPVPFDFVRIEAKKVSFMMGSPVDETNRGSDEVPSTQICDRPIARKIMVFGIMMSDFVLRGHCNFKYFNSNANFKLHSLT